MKSILKKFAEITLVAILALGMFSCSNGSSDISDELQESTETTKETVDTPTFSVAAGAVNSGTSVTITCATEGAKIYYTIDGSEPTASSTEYTAAISVTSALTIKAIALKDGMNDSEVASASYTVKGTVATPTFSVAEGAVNSGTSVTISCATEGAKIYYTTDGSEPTASSTEYTAAISVTPPVTIKAIAIKDGMNNSAVANASYTVKGTVAMPVFSIGSSAVNSGTSVIITCATEEAKIYYTTDGSEPTASSTEYTSAISVTPPVTIKAIAIKDGMNNSAVASASYTIKGTVATPVFSPASDAVDSGTSVTITCATEGAKIYYTTDGTEPTASSTEYTAAISVTPPVTIKAIAVKEGLNNSAVANASYTVKGTVAMPVFSIGSSAVNSGTSVTITCATEGAKIYYTTDGSEPTTSSTEYTAAISVTTAVKIKAIAVKEELNNSAVASYTIKTVATPTFILAENGKSVTISCATEEAKIYYTTDGSEPTASSTIYTTASFSVTTDLTIKAIAVKDGMINSAVARFIIPTKYTCVPGDFVLKNGTMLPKDITLSDVQKSNVAAVIVRAAADGKPALGVGIVHNKSGLKWCNWDAAGYDIVIKKLVGDKTSGYMDGSNSWDLLVEACSDLKEATAETIETVAQKYPSFNYCREYGTKNDLTEELATGWYLPTISELYTIYQNKTAVDESLSKAGGDQFATGSYRSCCQHPASAGYVRFQKFETGQVLGSPKNDSTRLCAVRAFN